jgi:uncharacterized membrane protein
VRSTRPVRHLKLAAGIEPGHRGLGRVRAQSPLAAAALALLFGALAYATYDLTNYATLRNWTLQITVVDIGYGALASSIAATAAYFAVRLIAR